MVVSGGNIIYIRLEASGGSYLHSFKNHRKGTMCLTNENFINSEEASKLVSSVKLYLLF